MGCEGIRGRTGARAWEVIHIYTGSFTPSPDPTPLPSPDLDKEGRVDNQRDTPPNTRLTVQPIRATSEFAYTLLATDRCTQWTEMRAVPNKAQKWVFEQLLVVRRLLPFELLGVHSDNGGEFINAHLQRYCEQQQIATASGCSGWCWSATVATSRAPARIARTTTTSRAEQKNFDVVRKHVGYARYDTPEAVALLNELYDRLRLMVNYVRPCAKLIEKTRDGARVRRRYDRPHTPCQRVLACEQVPEAVKQRLREQFAAIDPIALNDQIVHLQRRLLRLAAEHASPLARVG